MKWGVYSQLHVVLQSLEIAVLIKKHICWKVKIRTESNRGKKCMFDRYVSKIDVRHIDNHFADRDKLYEAPNQGFGRQLKVPAHTELLACSFLSLSKAKKNSMGVQEKDQLGPVKRIYVFEHSVMTNFNCACPAIQRGQGSGFLSEGSSWLTVCMSEQRRFWRDCADAQARLNLRCSHMR